MNTSELSIAEIQDLRNAAVRERDLRTRAIERAKRTNTVTMRRNAHAAVNLGTAITKLDAALAAHTATVVASLADTRRFRFLHGSTRVHGPGAKGYVIVDSATDSVVWTGDNRSEGEAEADRLNDPRPAGCTCDSADPSDANPTCVHVPDDPDGIVLQ